MIFKKYFLGGDGNLEVLIQSTILLIHEIFEVSHVHRVENMEEKKKHWKKTYSIDVKL